MDERAGNQWPSGHPRRLLILSCSRTKRPDPGLLPAIQRYDGPYYRVLRKYLRSDRPDVPNVLILSAEYGLIAPDHPIPDYDRVMTADRAFELRPPVIRTLKEYLHESRSDDVLICMGRIYRLALDGLENLVVPPMLLSLASGPIGSQLSQLRCWLYCTARNS